MRVFGYVVLGIVGFVAIVMLAGLLTVGNAFFQGEVAEKSRPGREKQIIQNPRTALDNYEHFYDDCTAVLRLNEQIAAGEAALKDARRSYDKEADTFGQGQADIARQRQDILGQRNQRATVAADYNALSAKEKTRSLFKANDLPYRIEPPYADITCGTLELAREECALYGHSYDVFVDPGNTPTTITCSRCGRSWKVESDD
jgi:hypothetical protein